MSKQSDSRDVDRRWHFEVHLAHPREHEDKKRWVGCWGGVG